ncbi:MAG: hypothetical protein GY847_31430 [Proteobacteria bacterium]|nr:hypothetical protein [Pseudomonadota bacterium]
MRFIVPGLVMGFIAFGSAGEAAAETKRDRMARKSFQEGVRAFEEARLGDALDAFKRAYGLRPSYRILFNIGQAEAELGHPHRAIESFEGYLADSGTRISRERRMSVEKEIMRLRKIVGEVIVEGPRGAEVWLEGERKGYLPLAGPILLPAGRHRLVVRHGKDEPCEQDIYIKGGEQIEETCLLLDHKLAIEKAVTLDERLSRNVSVSSNDSLEDDSENRGMRHFLDSVAPWIASGIAAATLTSAALCGWRASNLNAELKASCTDGRCPPERRNDVDALPGWAAATDGLFIATAVFSAAAVTLFIAPWKDDDERGKK